MINDTYKLCPQSSIPNSNKNSCMCQVENYYFDNISISCNLCSPGQFVSALGNQCTSCQSGYVLNDASTCIPIEQCGGYISLDQTSCVQNCSYNGTYYIDSMNKSCVFKCGVNDIKQNISNVLSCKSCSLVIQNSVASDNQRSECSNSTMLNKFCVSECSTNEFFDSSINQCVCTTFSQIIYKTCNSTSISFKNSCYQCKPNSQCRLVQVHLQSCAVIHWKLCP
ncbi:Growth_factor receptor cysteine-rich domain superfamily [Hexamita inflata]|uniref:Growth factor receptor cysteine-rich domain superfamily n=1 Tax=Hexamita inflata TaxID=28002 RepID=A0AA86NQ71_9EUKA|nr:Growth factor receptor cysteine-rich domain superfamily [Hexamita inflata]